MWRKLQGAKSAGRVQSVALRLVCERENEIEAFIAREYWTIAVGCRTHGGDAFTARLARLAGKKLDRFDLSDETSALAAVRAIEAATFQVGSVEKKQVGRNPSPPFSTSTLQQEASRKLGFAADRTMRTAQRLFEGATIDGEQVGLITYMRTDSVALSNDALGQCRRFIGQRFSERHLPDKPRIFKTKTKNAQEAHEAIRPTDVFRTPQEVGRYLEDDQRRLYELIWKRTVASQMAAAILDRVTAEIEAVDGSVGLRATGQTVTFPGFLELYQEGRDDPSADDEDDESRLLPPMVQGEPVAREQVTPAQHFHRAAAALFRSQPGQAHGGAGHRPALDLRLDPLGLAGARICAPGAKALRAGIARPEWSRHSSPRSSTSTCRPSSPRGSRTNSTMWHPAKSTGGRCCATSGIPSRPRSRT